MSLWEYLWAGSSTTKLLLHLNWNSTDASGNGNNWTDANITYSLANGKFWQGASFNWISSQIVIPHHTSLNIVDDITISVWINKWTNIAYSSFVEKAYNTSYFFGIWDNDNNLAFFYGWTQVMVTGVLSNSVWYNCVVSYNRSTQTLSFYVNWILVSNTTSRNPTVPWNTTNVKIWNQTTVDRFYNWNIDEVIIENVARSPEKIKRYYSMAKGRYWSL